MLDKEEPKEMRWNLYLVFAKQKVIPNFWVEIKKQGE